MDRKSDFYLYSKHSQRKQIWLVTVMADGKSNYSACFPRVA